MKKFFGLLLWCFYAHTAFSQGSFYTTVQAGPSLSFSTFDGYSGFYGSYRYPITTSKLTPLFGAGFGYSFPNGLVQAETGLYRTFPHILLDLDEWKQKPPRSSESKVYLWYNAWQVPVRLKLKLWQPSEKLNLRVIAGVVFTATQFSFKVKGDMINIGHVGRSMPGDFTFQTQASAALGRTYSLQGVNTHGLLNNCMIETGLEASYKICHNLDGLVSLIFQNGLQTRLSAEIYAKQLEPTTGQQVTWLASRNTSDGNALSLNFGVAYFFSKKNY